MSKNIKGILGILGDIHSRNDQRVLDLLPHVSKKIKKAVNTFATLHNINDINTLMKWILLGDVNNYSFLSGEEVEATNQFIDDLGDSIHVIEGNHDISDKGNHAILALHGCNKYLNEASIITLFDKKILMMPWLPINTKAYYEGMRLDDDEIDYAFGHFSNKETSGWGFDLSNIKAKRIYLGHEHIRANHEQYLGCLLPTAKNQQDIPIIKFIIIYDDGTDEVVTIELSRFIEYKEVEYTPELEKEIKLAEEDKTKIIYWTINNVPRELKNNLRLKYKSIKTMHVPIIMKELNGDRNKDNTLNLNKLIKDATINYVKAIDDKTIKTKLAGILSIDKETS